MKYDFGGYATRNNLTCTDGRVIKKDAFKSQNGETVPLVWNHNHDVDDVLGLAHLENREDGVYAYCEFNDTEKGKTAKEQLSGSKYGIAYIDGTEHVTQLNRSVENNLMKQIEYLTSMLYSQLGITQSILDGTADEKTMLNYYNRTIEPILSAIVDEMKRKFLTKTARTKNKSIKFFRDPFKLVPISEIAEITDKFTRNEVASSNEMRQVIGWKPSDDPKADELRNSNISQSDSEIAYQTDDENQDIGGEIQNEV